MKIRTSLVLACFLLSVLPLGGIVIYSYYSSRAALESAYHAEAGRLTAQMDRRLGNIRDVLEQRLAEVSALPNLSSAEKEKAPVVGNILMTMGEMAPLVDSIEIRPVRQPRPRPQPKARPVPTVAAAPAVASTARPATVVASAAPPPPPPAPSEESIVIDLPPMPKLPRFTFTEEQRQYLKQISTLGSELGRRRNELTEQQRADLQKQLNAAQTAFSESMKTTQKQFNEELTKALKAREDHMNLRQQQRDAERAQGDRERAQEQADAAREAEQERVDAEKEAAADAANDAAADASADSQSDAGDATPDVHEETKASEKEKAHWKMREKQATMLFGQRFNVPVTNDGAVVGQLRAHVSGEEVIRRVLGSSNDDSGEITFAVDR